MAMNPAEIATLTRKLASADTTELSNADLLVQVNQAYERTTAFLIKETIAGKWPYEDFNFTSFPTYTVTLRDSDPEYDLKEFSSIPLTILGADVLDQDGNFQVMHPLKLSELRRRGIAASEYAETDGRPFEYEMRGNIMVLYPAPDNGVTVTLANGLRLYYLRTASVITDMTDTTTDLGLPSPFVDVVAYEAAMPHAISQHLPNLKDLRTERKEKREELVDFVSRRHQDGKPVMRMKGSRHSRGHLTPDGGHHHGHHFI